jgi:hypothetical protein
MCAMQDLVRDWRHWTMPERIAAILIAVILLSLIPLTFAL